MITGRTFLNGLLLLSAIACALLSESPSSVSRAARLESHSISSASSNSEELTSWGALTSRLPSPELDRVETPRPSGASGGSPRRLDDGSARLEARLELIARRFGPFVSLQENGRRADRPLLLNAPAQGPPARG